MNKKASLCLMLKGRLCYPHCAGSGAAPRRDCPCHLAGVDASGMGCQLGWGTIGMGPPGWGATRMVASGTGCHQNVAAVMGGTRMGYHQDGDTGMDGSGMRCHQNGVTVMGCHWDGILPG